MTRLVAGQDTVYSHNDSDDNNIRGMVGDGADTPDKGQPNTVNKTAVFTILMFR